MLHNVQWLMAGYCSTIDVQLIFTNFRCSFPFREFSLQDSNQKPFNLLIYYICDNFYCYLLISKLYKKVVGNNNPFILNI